MISFFQRALTSWFALGLLGLALIGFVLADVSGLGPMGGGADRGAVIAKAGDVKVTVAELERQLRNKLDAARREQPNLDQKTFLAAGGFESVAEGLIGARSIDGWGRKQGFAISKRLIDAEIVKMAAFRGVTGQFDEEAMRQALAQAGINEKQFRADLASDIMRGQILNPVIASTSASAQLASPYATVLLEERTGSVAIIPFQAVADPRRPTEAEIAAAYKTNIATYTRPEARVLRYALFGAAQVAAAATPTEAEIAKYYQDNAANYAARETRSLSQVITPDQALANSIATAARQGTSLAAAATKAGLEASTLADQTRTAYAGSANEAIAGQVFSAARGGVVGPTKGAFGWYVVRVDSITDVPSRSLDQARPEIAAALGKQKSEDALADLSDKIENSIEDGASFAEIAANNKLTVVETPPILSTGQAVDQPDWKAPPELAALLKPGFEIGADEKPEVETVVKDQQYAMLGVAKVVPPTPLPLAQVHEAVARDIMRKRAVDRAQAIARQIVAAVNRGVPLAKAIADTGVKLPPPQPARARQLDLARAQQSGQPVPEPVNALFTLQKGKAKLAGAAREALFVTVLDTVTPGDLAKAPGLVDSTRQELAQSLANELGEQFVRAIEQDIKVQRDPKAIAAAKRQFAGGQ